MTLAVIIIAIIVGLIIGACWVGTEAGSGPKDSPIPAARRDPNGLGGHWLAWRLTVDL